MAEVIPGFAACFDTPDLLTCFAPRRVLILSATDDLFHTMLIMWLPPHRHSVLIWAVWRASLTTATKANRL